VATHPACEFCDRYMLVFGLRLDACDERVLAMDNPMLGDADASKGQQVFVLAPLVSPVVKRQNWTSVILPGGNCVRRSWRVLRGMVRRRNISRGERLCAGSWWTVGWSIA
jgi:hypothetical protein